MLGVGIAVAGADDHRTAGQGVPPRLLRDHRGGERGPLRVPQRQERRHGAPDVRRAPDVLLHVGPRHRPVALGSLLVGPPEVLLHGVPHQLRFLSCLGLRLDPEPGPPPRGVAHELHGPRPSQGEMRVQPSGGGIRPSELQESWGALAPRQPLRHPQVLLQDRHVPRGDAFTSGSVPFAASSWHAGPQVLLVVFHHSLRIGSIEGAAAQAGPLAMLLQACWCSAPMLLGVRNSASAAPAPPSPGWTGHGRRPSAGRSASPPRSRRSAGRVGPVGPPPCRRARPSS